MGSKILQLNSRKKEILNLWNVSLNFMSLILRKFENLRMNEVKFMVNPLRCKLENQHYNFSLLFLCAFLFIILEMPTLKTKLTVFPFAEEGNKLHS